MVEAQALATAYQTRFRAGPNSGLAGASKGGCGGRAGPRPHELLEAALATCITISARMALEEIGIDGAGVTARVWLERTDSASTFHYSLALDSALSGEQRERVLARVMRSAVRTTLERGVRFAEHDRPPSPGRPNLQRTPG